jgi:hypothetical protein
MYSFYDYEYDISDDELDKDVPDVCTDDSTSLVVEEVEVIKCCEPLDDEVVSIKKQKQYDVLCVEEATNSRQNIRDGLDQFLKAFSPVDSSHIHPFFNDYCDNLASDLNNLLACPIKYCLHDLRFIEKNDQLRFLSDSKAVFTSVELSSKTTEKKYPLYIACHKDLMTTTTGQMMMESESKIWKKLNIEELDEDLAYCFEEVLIQSFFRLTDMIEEAGLSDDRELSLSKKTDCVGRSSVDEISESIKKEQALLLFEMSISVDDFPEQNLCIFFPAQFVFNLLIPDDKDIKTKET